MADKSPPESPLLAQFVDALRQVPGATADVTLSQQAGLRDRGFDAEVGLRIGDRAFALLVDVKKAVFPRDVRQAVWHSRRASQEWQNEPAGRPWPLIVAESISPGAKDLLRTEGVGYYDSGGSLFLPAPGAFIHIDKPPSRASVRAARALFSGRRAQVLHALLVRHHDWFGVTQLAQLATVSPATASQVLTELERFDWVSVRGHGPSKARHLREPAALLDAWSRHVAASRPAVLRRYFVPGTKADDLLTRVGEAFDTLDVPYAISHEAAAQRYAPFLSSIPTVRVRATAGRDTDEAIGRVGARVVHEGANLAIIEAKSPGELLFRERVDGVWLASPIQIYLDLLAGEGRSREMAEHLRKERIGF
jgi:hypothetical protein